MSSIAAASSNQELQSASACAEPTAHQPDPIIMEECPRAADLANRYARFLARFIDLLITSIGYLLAVLLLSLILVSLLGLHLRASAATSTILIVGLTILPFVIGFTYEIVLTSMYGGTLGKRLVGLMIVQAGTIIPISSRQARKRALRQLLLCILVPLGFISTVRLLCTSRRSLWYDSGLDIEVLWNASPESRRRRHWTRAESHMNRNQDYYIAGFFWIVGLYFFLQSSWPPDMTEIQASDGIRTLINLNGVALVAFIGATYLAKYSRSTRVSDHLRNFSAATVIILGTASLTGVLSGVSYLTTMVEGVNSLDFGRQMHRMVAFVSLVTSLYAMVALWAVRIALDRVLENDDPPDLPSLPEESSPDDMSNRATDQTIRPIDVKLLRQNEPLKVSKVRIPWIMLISLGCVVCAAFASISWHKLIRR